MQRLVDYVTIQSMQLFSILLLTSLSGIISLSGAFLLSLKKDWPKKFLLQLTAFSSGVLLATALLHLAPEAVEDMDGVSFFNTVFVSILSFFIFEKLLLWHHHHEEEAHCGPQPSAILITLGDSIHNFIDGILIASAFLISPNLGLLTAFAVAAHEIPQEIADFSVMVAGGMKRKRALFFNFISALASVLGAVIAYFFSLSIEWVLPYALTFSVGMFLYIALSDLIPELHKHDLGQKQKATQLFLFFVGIGVIILTGLFEVH